MDLSEEDVIKRVLAEVKLEPVRALAGLLHTLVDWHLGSKRRPGGDGGRGPNATMLEELSARLGLQAQHNLRAYERLAGDGKVDDAKISDDAFMDGLIRGQQAGVQQALAQIFFQCQQLGERQAEQEREEARIMGEAEPTGPGGEEDDQPPPMRLVTD